MKKKKNHYPDCEINNGGECDCDGNYDPKNQKSWGLEKFYDEAVDDYMSENSAEATLIEKWSKRLDQELIKELEEVEKEVRELEEEYKWGGSEDGDGGLEPGYPDFDGFFQKIAQRIKELKNE